MIRCLSVGRLLTVWGYLPLMLKKENTLYLLEQFETDYLKRETELIKDIDLDE